MFSKDKQKDIIPYEIFQEWYLVYRKMASKLIINEDNKVNVGTQYDPNDFIDFKTCANRTDDLSEISIINEDKTSFQTKEENLLCKKRSEHKTIIQEYIKNKPEKSINITRYKPRGRKPKYKRSESNFIDSHTKYSPDNILKTIKTNLFEYIRLWLCKTIIDRENLFNKENFLKIEYKKNICNLKKVDNLNLMNKTIAEIFSSDISKKYVHYEKDYNAKLIKKILGEKKCLNTISILGLTFREVLQIFIGNITNEIQNKINEETLSKFDRLECMLDKIKARELKGKEINKIYLERYLKQIKLLCLKFEQWFIDKRQRI